LDINGTTQIKNFLMFLTSDTNAGNIVLSGSSDNMMLFKNSNAAGANTGWIVGQSTRIAGGEGFGIARMASANISSNTGIYMSSAGLVGIGCNAPSYGLDINGSIGTNNQMVFTGNGGGYGHIRLRGNENTMFFHDSNVTTFDGWFVGQSVSTFGAGNGNGFGIARTTNGIIAASNGLYIRTNSGNTAGCVSVNTNTNNTYPLLVEGYAGFTSSGNFFNSAQSVGSYSSGSYNTSIFSRADVLAGAFRAYSDSRIKENIQDVQDDDALQRLRLIQPKTYTYKDVFTKGTEPVYGFIAQQVRDVLPYATNTLKNYIPDIYKLGDRVDDLVTLRDSTFLFNESSGNVRFIQKSGGDMIVPVNFISSNQLQILDKTKLDLTDSEIFVYGREVEDFHSLDKNAIFTINVAATQELDRQLQAAKVQITSLETRLALLESQFAASQTQQ
jgi:hypothetical protein